MKFNIDSKIEDKSNIIAVVCGYNLVTQQRLNITAILFGYGISMRQRLSVASVKADHKRIWQRSSLFFMSEQKNLGQSRAVPSPSEPGDNQRTAHFNHSTGDLPHPSSHFTRTVPLNQGLRLHFPNSSNESHSPSLLPFKNPINILL